MHVKPLNILIHFNPLKKLIKNSHLPHPNKNKKSVSKKIKIAQMSIKYACLQLC